MPPAAPAAGVSVSGNTGPIAPVSAVKAANAKKAKLPVWSIGDKTYTLFRDGNPTGTEIRIFNLSGGSPFELVNQANVSNDLLTFARWAIAQFQGESGAGESHWEQFAQYRAGRRAVAKAEKGGEL